MAIGGPYPSDLTKLLIKRSLASGPCTGEMNVLCFGPNDIAVGTNGQIVVWTIPYSIRIMAVNCYCRDNTGVTLADISIRKTTSIVRGTVTEVIPTAWDITSDLTLTVEGAGLDAAGRDIDVNVTPFLVTSVITTTGDVAHDVSIFFTYIPLSHVNLDSVND